MTSGALIGADRGRVRAVAAVSSIMLAISGIARWSAPSPLAPRVHVRWAADVSDADRAEIEARFKLAGGRDRGDATWDYELVQPAPSNVLELVHHPAVADTHYIDRTTGEVAANAPRGTTRLELPGAAGWIYSPLFTWFMALWISCLTVSGVWLISAARRR